MEPFLRDQQYAGADRPLGPPPGLGGLANTYYWIDQARGVGGVYATQILPFADTKSLPLFHAFEKAVYDARPAAAAVLGAAAKVG